MVNDSNITAVVAGHLCLDITPGFMNTTNKELAEMISPGRTLTLSGVKISTGGVVSNTGLALSVLGIPTKLMGKTGRDYFGDIVLQILKERGICDGIHVCGEAATSFSIVLAPAGVDRMFLHEPGANALFDSGDIDYDIVASASLFHFGYPTAMRNMYLDNGAELVKVFSSVKALNVVTSMDLSLPDAGSEAGKADWKCILKSVLPYVDIFAPSLEEIFYILRNEEYNRLYRSFKGGDAVDALDMNILQELGCELLQLGVKIAVIKCGKKGYYIRTQKAEQLTGLSKALPFDLRNWSGRELLEEAYHADTVVSANGAGDTSIAGFLASLMKGKSIEQSVKMACATGSLCVQAFDALSGIKPMEETEALIRKGWVKDRVKPDGSYWNYDSDRQVWVGRQDALYIRK